MELNGWSLVEHEWNWMDGTYTSMNGIGWMDLIYEHEVELNGCKVSMNGLNGPYGGEL
jgi:hypothetical protein